jgi:hypothetical protein
MKKQIAGILVFAAAIVLGAELPAGVPKGATEVGQGRYRFVDKDKKVWTYRMTPLGFQRSLESQAKDAPAPAAADASEQGESEPGNKQARTETPFGKSGEPAEGMPATKVTEVGDSIRFERPSPFGVYRWTRKKTELTADERRLWEQHQSAPARASNQ